MAFDLLACRAGANTGDTMYMHLALGETEDRLNRLRRSRA